MQYLSYATAFAASLLVACANTSFDAGNDSTAHRSVVQNAASAVPPGGPNPNATTDDATRGADMTGTTPGPGTPGDSATPSPPGHLGSTPGSGGTPGVGPSGTGTTTGAGGNTPTFTGSAGSNGSAGQITTSGGTTGTLGSNGGTTGTPGGSSGTPALGNSPGAGSFPGVLVTRVGVNFEDERSHSDIDYNDAVLCFKGNFAVDNSNVVSTSKQTVVGTTYSNADCRHKVSVVIVAANGTRSAPYVYDSRQTAPVNMNFDFGSRLEVTMVSSSSACDPGVVKSMHLTSDAQVAPDLCRTH